MIPPQTTLEELWSRQQISSLDVDYAAWHAKRESVQLFSRMSRSCVFTVDVYKGAYDFASDAFADLFGIKEEWLKNIHLHPTLLEDRIHPDDRQAMTQLRVRHAEFIYGLDPAQRNDYRTMYRYRMRNARNQYINVVSRQQVMEPDRKGKAWIISGMLEIDFDPRCREKVDYAVLNLRTGRICTPRDAAAEEAVLTPREREVLELAARGLLSKEIAGKLGLSLYTVHNHRKNILAKLGAGNIVEAINRAKSAGQTG